MDGSYGLYQTLSIGCESEKKLTVAQKKSLASKLKNTNDQKTEAIFMLICEHARLNDDFIYDPTSIKLPYSMKKQDNDVLVSVEDLPIPLQRILWKFSNID